MKKHRKDMLERIHPSIKGGNLVSKSIGRKVKGIKGGKKISKILILMFILIPLFTFSLSNPNLVFNGQNTEVKRHTATNIYSSNNMIQNKDIEEGEYENFNKNPHKPKASDVSGNELYAEQIGVNIAGNLSMIQHSYITNDTNIFARMDFSDPAFTGASFVISTSNGKEPDMYPTPIRSNMMEQISLNYDIPRGFLFYDNSSDYETVQVRKNRALNIFKNIFKMDFIITNKFENESMGYLYNFIADYPSIDVWEEYFYTITSNVPEEGYWDSFKKERLISESYLSKNHLSTDLVYVSSFSSISQGIANVSSDEFQTNFDLSILDSFEQFSTLLSPESLNNSMVTSLLGGGTQSEIMDALEDLDLEGTVEDFEKYLTNVVLCSVQYESCKECIQPIEDGGGKSYNFDLFKALDYNGTKLEVTSKSYNSIIGALLSGITVNIHSAEPTGMNPNELFLSEYNLNRIEELIFLTGGGEGFDISTLRDYSFKIGWASYGSTLNLLTIPQNSQDENDPINALDIFGNIGLPIILGSLLNPLETFQINYTISEFDPYLHITKNFENGSRMLVENPQMTVNVTNPGQHDVWGQKVQTEDLSLLINLLSEGAIDVEITNDPTQSLTIFDDFLGTNNIEELFDAIENQGYVISDYFHDDDPRLFMVDTYGTGIPDYFYPEINITNPYVLAPYSSDFVDEVLTNPEVISELPLDLQATATLLVTGNVLDNPESIFNPDNWKIQPDEGFSYTADASNVSLIDQYRPFHQGEFNTTKIEGVSPTISYGEHIGIYGIESTYEKDEGREWKITSEQVNGEHEIQYYLTFENQTSIKDWDNENISLDALNFEIDFDTQANFTEEDIRFEIFNYSKGTYGEFQQLDISFSNLLNITDGIINITLSNIEYKITDFLKVSENMAVLLRSTYIQQNQYQMNFDLIKMRFLERINIMNPQMSANILYQTELGIAQYSTSSNTVNIGSYDCSSLYGTATMNKYESYCGDLVQYNLTLHNIGNHAANNIIVMMEQPGLIYGIKDINHYLQDGVEILNASAGNFTIKRGMLSYSIDSLKEFSSIENLTFTFFVPNSREIPDPYIFWDEETDLIENSSDYFVYGNEQYISAPIDYSSKSKTPYYHSLEISYETNFLDTDDVPLTTDNECFTVNISIKNIGEQKIYDLHMLPAKEINGLRYENESNRIWIEELDSEEEQKVQLQYNKTSYRGYLISAPVFTTAMENSFIREKPGNPLLLGRFNLTIVKTFEKLESDIGEVITIDINITNTGTLELGNFTLDDTLSYDSAGFNIKRGVMIKEISYLGPGEKDSLQYTLRARAKGIFKMNPAKVEYYYKYRQIVNSNIENFVVHEPSWLMTGRIYLPIILGVFTMLTTYHYKTKYNKADLELQRKEKLLFGADLRDTSWHKRTLKEMLEMEFKSKNGGDQK